MAAPALPAESANDARRVPEGDIAVKAFAYYCERGGADGRDLDDWLRAERELQTPPKLRRRKAER